MDKKIKKIKKSGDGIPMEPTEIKYKKNRYNTTHTFITCFAPIHVHSFGGTESYTTVTVSITHLIIS